MQEIIKIRKGTTLKKAIDINAIKLFDICANNSKNMILQKTITIEIKVNE